MNLKIFVAIICLLISNRYSISMQEFASLSTTGKYHANEDVYITPSSTKEKLFFDTFAIFDGHGGIWVAKYLEQHLLENIFSFHNLVFKDAIKQGFLKTNADILEIFEKSNQTFRVGSTAILIFLTCDTIFVANVGDCRAVLCSNNITIPLSTDHNTSNSAEVSRIESLGGNIGVSHHGGPLPRVEYELLVTRAFGDYNLRNFIVPEPEIMQISIQPNNDKFLIIASDGLWNKVKNEEAVNLVKTNQNLEQACSQLIALAKSRQSRDDITVIIVKF